MQEGGWGGGGNRRGGQQLTGYLVTFRPKTQPDLGATTSGAAGSQPAGAPKPGWAFGRLAGMARRARPSGAYVSILPAAGCSLGWGWGT